MGCFLPSVDENTFLFPSQVMSALDKRYETYMSAGAHGVVGDGITDDSAALNALLAAAAAFGAGVLLDPKTVVLAVANPITIPSGTRLDMNGSTIKSALPSTGSRLLIVANASNVRIEGGTLDGDRASFAPATEQRHNLHITGSSNVTIRDVITVRAKGDGVYVGDQNGVSRDIYLENVVSDQNWRQGLSISHVSGFVALGCEFTNTAGTDPQAGVDIEPNVSAVVCENIRFVSCTMKGNAHFGFLVAIQTNPTARQGDITLVGCDIVGNGVANDGAGGGIRLIGVTDFSMLGGSVRANVGPGVVGNGTSVSTNVNFVGVAVESNTTHGFSVALPIAAFSIESCSIRNNSQAGSGQYDGINMVPSATMSNPKLKATSITGSHRYAVTTGANVTGLQSIGNDFAGYVSGPTNLLDDPSTRMQTDSTAISFGPRVLFWASTGSSSPAISVRRNGDTSDRMNVLGDGRQSYSDGASAVDVVLQRSGAGVWGMTSGKVLRIPGDTTANRPLAASVGGPGLRLNTSTHILEVTDGVSWYNAGTGAVVSAT